MGSEKNHCARIFAGSFGRSACLGRKRHYQNGLETTELFDAVERVRSSFLCERLGDWAMVEAVTDKTSIFEICP